jgi:hypothetical protein
MKRYYLIQNVLQSMLSYTNVKMLRFVQIEKETNQNTVSATYKFLDAEYLFSFVLVQIERTNQSTVSGVLVRL